MDSGVLSTFSSFCYTPDTGFTSFPHSSFTSPDVPEVAYPEGFQGNEIPLDGEAVARRCLDRLTLSDEADD